MHVALHVCMVVRVCHPWINAWAMLNDNQAVLILNSWVLYICAVCVLHICLGSHKSAISHYWLLTQQVDRSNLQNTNL